MKNILTVLILLLILSSHRCTYGIRLKNTTSKQINITCFGINKANKDSLYSERLNNGEFSLIPIEKRKISDFMNYYDSIMIYDRESGAIWKYKLDNLNEAYDPNETYLRLK